jgi:hypothetical protein
VKDSLDVTDDLDHATSLSYTSHMPLNNSHPAQSATSIPSQHGIFYNDKISQSPADGEGFPPQAYHDSHPQSQQHTGSSPNSSWDLLGGARKFGEAYEHFDSRNASEQHLAFADGDLPNSKVKLSIPIAFDTELTTCQVCSLLSIPSERVNRDAMDVVHRSYHAHRLDPRDSRCYGVPTRKGSLLACIRAAGS